MWHFLAKLHLDVGGVIVQHATFHATPFGRYRRADECERVVSTMTRPASRVRYFVEFTNPICY